MSINHHLDDATLMSHAAGSLASALSAVAAAHLAMCRRCREELAIHERIGAELVAGLPAMAMQRPAPAMPRFGGLETVTSPAAPIEIPAPLAHLIAGSLDEVRWRWIGPGVWHRPLPISGTGALQLLKASPGASVPEHGHGGSELTLVLRGALVDDTGRYEPGDVADVDEGIEHTPSADADAGCICVIANEAPTRFRGIVARLMQHWHGL